MQDFDKNDRSIDRTEREEARRYFEARSGSSVVAALGRVHEIMVHTSYVLPDGRRNRVPASDCEVVAALIDKHVALFHARNADTTEYVP